MYSVLYREGPLKEVPLYLSQYYYHPAAILSDRPVPGMVQQLNNIIYNTVLWQDSDI